MKYFLKVAILNIIFFVGIGHIVQGQQYDILIKDGHLVDPKNNIDQQMDVAVSNGIITQVSKNIPENKFYLPFSLQLSATLKAH